MKPFTTLESLVVPLDRTNVDTDAIIPKQFMKSVKRTGFGPNLFDEWRYLDHGEPGQDISSRHPNPDFSINQSQFTGAQVLLTRENFGCGSSREHAVWALSDFGIRVMIAPSFADIFYGNCFKNGLLPIRLEERIVENLFDLVAQPPGLRLEIDLKAQTIRLISGEVIQFGIEPERKRRLLEGLDDIALTLAQVDLVREYERTRRAREPWLSS